MNTATRQPATIGPYRVVDVSGEGGMGRVYRAIHATRHHVVAIKVLHSAVRDDQAVARVVNEARIHAGLHHPNIVRFHELLEWEGRPCLVMEYVDGHTLSELLKTSGALPPRQALRIFQQIVEAVAYIHRHDIVHRDLKPHNIRLTSDGRVKLLDFGIARNEDTPKMTQTGFVIGTLEYLSPEQLRSGQASQLSDIWALGILLYEMISGTVPFAAGTFGTFYEKINQARFRSSPELRKAVPREVWKLISRCLKKHPQNRYQSASELLTEVRRLNEAPPSTRHPLFRVSAFMRQAQAHRPKLPVVAAGVLALIIGWWLFSSSLPNDPNLHSIRIEPVDGPAELFQDNRYLGTTPYEIHAHVGERVTLELRREGLRKPVEFFVTDNKKVYAEPLR